MKMDVRTIFCRMYTLIMRTNEFFWTFLCYDVLFCYVFFVCFDIWFYVSTEFKKKQTNQNQKYVFKFKTSHKISVSVSSADMFSAGAKIEETMSNFEECLAEAERSYKNQHTKKVGHIKHRITGSFGISTSTIRC